MRKRVAKRTVKKASPARYYELVNSTIPRLGSNQIRRISRLLDTCRIRGISDEQITEIVAFIKQFREQRAGALPRRTDLRDRFDFLRYQDIPHLVLPPQKPFAQRRTSESKSIYHERTRMHHAIDKRIEERYHGQIADLGLVTVKLNWKHWMQNYFLEHGRLPTDTQVMPVVGTLIAFVKKNPDPKQWTTQNYGRFIGQRS